jgi:hypothetical protein
MLKQTDQLSLIQTFKMGGLFTPCGASQVFYPKDIKLATEACQKYWDTGGKIHP